MNPRISIVVPVHNAEEFLRGCLDSIKAQTFLDFEVVLVDDGSTDGSLEILGRYRDEDVRFHLYQQKHRGVSAARNTCLNYSTGEYVCFVDADDQITPTFLEDLYQAIEDQVDSSMGGFKKIDMLSHEEFEVIPDKKIETLEENLLEFYDSNDKDWQRYLWNRMFKSSVIKDHNLLFREDIYYKEDGLFLIQYLCASNGLIGCVDKVLYHYHRNTTGAMSKTWHTFDKRVITNLEAHRQIIEELRKRKVSNLIISKAENQAKAACNWILQMMWNAKSTNLTLLARIETIMISILGFKGYISWRVSQFFKSSPFK